MCREIDKVISDAEASLKQAYQPDTVEVDPPDMEHTPPRLPLLGGKKPILRKNPTSS
ncbi:MAG: hypothetical protein Q7R77_03335 [Candidatus Daviesbacteria bacterium]|nr:hypothetical protein [Candidatus Daviesbacteria bacterium]